jgi:hypothetical protein
MPFDRQLPNTPTAIGEIRIMLADANGVAADMKAGFFVQVFNQNGELFREISGDLAPHLSTAQRNGLIQLMQDMRAKAVAEILPAP